MTDTYGSGLSFGASGEQAGSPLDIAPQLDNSGALPAGGLDTPPSAPAPQPPQSNGPSFGSSLSWMTGRPNYTPPDPAASALDQSADLLKQQAARASVVGTNPLTQFFYPEKAAEARTALPKIAEQLQQIQQQKAAVQAGRVQAQTMGLTPDEAPDQATQDDRVQIAMGKAVKGDMRAFQGLQAVAPDHAASIAPQVYATVAGHLTNAQTAFDSLSGMENEGQYQAKIKQLRTEGTIGDLESLGLKLPPTFEAFNAAKASEGLALRNARIAVNGMGQQLEERNTYQPMEKKEAETYSGRLTTAYGDQITNGSWSRNAASGTRGAVVNGLATPDALGKGGVLGSADQRKAIGEDFKAAVPDKDLEKYRNFNRTYALATQDAKGNAIPSEGVKDAKTGRMNYINDNPNVQQGIAEGLASMLRGGTGGATAGLLNIESDKRGAVQSVFDKIQTAYAGALNTLTGEQVRPYLTQLTEQQQRQVLDGLKGYTGNSVTDRSLAVARRAGALGFGADALGLGTDEAGDKVNAAIEEGRQAQIARMRPNFQAVGGGDGVLQLGAQRPGAGAIELPPGAPNRNQLPGAQPLLTPVQQATQNNPASGALPPGTPSASPPAPPIAPHPGSGGAGPNPTPVTIAGQQVNVSLPPGASPTYVNSLQRIETGTARNPWTAGAQGTSAGGAYQFIKTTWDANKPPGAPARAADATPEQQTAALEKLTATNASALQTSGIPVNDTNLYVTHNLGTTGGPRLLQADPNANARTVVGETAAKNNPQFFRGRPTVAVALQRYADAVNAPALPSSDQGMAMGTPMDDPAAMAWNNLTPAQQEQGRKGGIDMLEGAAPAAASTVGAIAGGALGGPPGAIAGGAAGGAAGTALKNYLRGKPQDAVETAEQAALGGVLGVASAGSTAARIVAAGARVAGSGAIKAGTEAAKGGDTADVVDAGARGAAEGLAGEAFGRALGMVGHKVFSLFTADSKAAVQDAAKTYADSSKVLETEPPKIPGAAGAAAVANPKFDAAQTAKDQAEIKLKDAGLDPEEAAYAHKVSSESVPTQEAQASKPGAVELARVGQGYDQLRNEVGDAGVGAVKFTPKLADGPLATAQNAKMAPELTRAAERAEVAITAPATDWRQKWNGLQIERSKLLQGERDALGSMATGKTQTAQDYRTLADSIRTQQAKAANYVFGPQQGPQVMQRLQALDVRYRRLMDATNGGDLARAANLKGAAGRDADQKFKAFAANDPTAIAAWNAMRGAGPNYEKGVLNLVAAERIPVLGKLYSGVKLLGSFNRWMQERAAGSPAKFSDILNAAPDRSARNVRDAASGVTTRAAVQGGVGASP